jgi:hypothetical protein
VKHVGEQEMHLNVPSSLVSIQAVKRKPYRTPYFVQAVAGSIQPLFAWWQMSLAQPPFHHSPGSGIFVSGREGIHTAVV